MKFKRAEMSGAQGMVWVVVILAAVYLFAQYYTPSSVVPQEKIDSGGKLIEKSLNCPYAPTVKLSANNKYDAGQTNWGDWRYRLNSGGATTDSDGSFEIPSEGVVTMDVLVADANSSAFYRAIWTPDLHCGLNPLGYNDVVGFTTYETKCYNENGDPINGTTYQTTNANLSIGSAGSRSVKCEIEGVSKKGMPYGGMMILEFNQSTYKKEDLNSVTLGGAWGSQKVTPESSTVGAYTVGVAGGTTKSFKVPSIEETGTYEFTLNTLQAKSSINPSAGGPCVGDATYGDGIFGRIYPINCYEEEDVSPTQFECGLSDMDDTFMSPGGTSKSLAQVTTFCIPVQ